MGLNLSYGVLGFGRRYMVGVTGVGRGTGVTTVCHAADRELLRMGLRDRVSLFDEPSDLREMDMVIGVIDPLPSLIKSEIAKYSELKNLYDHDRDKTVFLLNKMNVGVDRRELERFLRLEFVYVQDLIPYEKFYEMEYCCRDIHDNRKGIEFKGVNEMIHSLFSASGPYHNFMSKT